MSKRMPGLDPPSPPPWEDPLLLVPLSFSPSACLSLKCLLTSWVPLTVTAFPADILHHPPSLPTVVLFLTSWLLWDSSFRSKKTGHLPSGPSELSDHSLGLSPRCTAKSLLPSKSPPLEKNLSPVQGSLGKVCWWRTASVLWWPHWDVSEGTDSKAGTDLDAKDSCRLRL